MPPLAAYDSVFAINASTGSAAAGRAPSRDDYVFVDSGILTERFLGLPKSYIAVRLR